MDMRIGIAGCAGRMGQMLVRQVGLTEGAVVSGGLEATGSEAIGRDLGTLAGLDPLGVMVTDDAAELFAHADAVLEFTSPEATVAHAKLAAQAHTIHVIGTTGLDAGPDKEEPLCPRESNEWHRFASWTSTTG